MFLTADAVSMTLDNVVSGLVVYPARIHSRLMEELPFMVSDFQNLDLSFESHHRGIELETLILI